MRDGVDDADAFQRAREHESARHDRRDATMIEARCASAQRFIHGAAQGYADVPRAFNIDTRLARYAC